MAGNARGLWNGETTILIHDNSIIAYSEPENARGAGGDIDRDAVAALAGAINANHASSLGCVVGNLEIDLAIGGVKQRGRLIIDEDSGSGEVGGERECALLRSSHSE